MVILRRSVAAAKMAQLPESQAEIARKLGRSLSSVSRWMGGRGDPPVKMRVAISQLWPHIQPHDWLEVAPAIDPAIGVPPPVGERPPAEPATPEAVESLAAALMADARQIHSWAQNLDPASKMKALDSVSKLVGQLAKLTGEEISDRKVLNSPSWARIRDAVLDALEAYPDALRDVTAVLEEHGE